MSRSSIFNFESFEGFKPRVPWAALLALVLLGGVELWARLMPNDTLYPQASSWGQLRLVEREALVPHPHPQVVFLGSSRMRDALVPRLAERELGLSEGAVLNLALGGGRVYDALLMYERNRAQLKGATLIVVGVDEWHFSLGESGVGPLFNAYAPLADRARLPEPPRNALVTDWLFNMRLKVPLLYQAFLRAVRGEEKKGVRMSIDENGQLVDLRDAPKSERSAEEVLADVTRMSRMHYANFRIEPVLVEQAERLAALAKEDGARVVFMQLPNRGLYRDEVLKNFAAPYAAHLETLTALCQRAGASCKVYEYPAACGLNDDQYLDYGHLMPSGAQTFTRFAARLIKEEGWLAP